MFEGFLSPDGELAAKKQPATGKAYVFRGMGGRFASFEMDYLRDKIAASGIEAETYNHINWYGPARRGDRPLQERIRSRSWRWDIPPAATPLWPLPGSSRRPGCRSA